MTEQVRPVEADQWPIVGWLWQDFRHDLGSVVHGFPYADGRYQHRELDEYPGPGRAGYLAWAPHPNLDGELAPIGFALVKGLDEARRALAAFFVVPAARRRGAGRHFAGAVIDRHPGAWEVAFQHDNHTAANFWRMVASDSFGTAWTEEVRPVPARPGVPPDHWILAG